MHNIIPLSQVSRQAINDMAKTAVDNREPITVNPFEAGSVSFAHWEFDYNAYERELAAID